MENILLIDIPNIIGLHTMMRVTHIITNFVYQFKKIQTTVDKAYIK